MFTLWMNGTWTGPDFSAGDEAPGPEILRTVPESALAASHQRIAELEGVLERVVTEGAYGTTHQTIRIARSSLAQRPDANAERCKRCGGENPSWSAASPLWNAVIRGGSINGEAEFNDMVCATCFMALAEEKGIANGFRVTAETVNVELETTTPSGRVWDDEAFRWVEPEQTYDGEICQDCRNPLGYVWDAPDWLWERVMGGPGGVLCATCFVRRVEAELLSDKCSCGKDHETGGMAAWATGRLPERGPDCRLLTWKEIAAKNLDTARQRRKEAKDALAERDRLLNRARLAATFRDWIHDQPFSKCNAGVDVCPDWPLAYELTDLVRSLAPNTGTER